MNLATYLPQDRRFALAHGIQLPTHAHGTVLLADISGFTPFTESLRQALGPRRGAEELSYHLDTVYTALIAEVERYGGSVLGFAGDAITCWFDTASAPAPPRAVACAVALQTTMLAFQTIPLPDKQTGQLRIKVAVATGMVRRLVVGDAQHYWLDALVGKTVRRTAVGEHLAAASEVLLDQATAEALGESVRIHEWRTDTETAERFAVLAAFETVVPTVPTPILLDLDQNIVVQWLDAAVYQHGTGHTTFLTEFRPCVALFIRFAGIDYDGETVEADLKAFVEHILAVISRYEGTLIDLTFGDKGSYAYLNFGALRTHEDDARRAVKTAVAIQLVAQQLGFIESLQIGITYGVMHTGAYGGPTRRHYGALGDEVNLAARLMQAAVPGEILVSGHIYKAVQDQFLFEPRPPLQVKGKRAPISTYRFTAEQHLLHLPEPAYGLPMVGRQAELAVIGDKLTLAAAGQAQIVSVVGEAGLGKSRLAAEAIKLAHGRGFVTYGGACQSDGLNTPYLVWKPILSALLGLVSTDQSPAQQAEQVAQFVAQRVPHRLDVLPLLGGLLNLPIAENSFTQSLEPKYRQTALHALVEDCLKQALPQTPHLLVIEDLHWIDALSHDLLDELSKSLASYPIFFLLIYRPTKLARLQVPRLEERPYFTPLVLHELDEGEAAQAIRAKLTQLYPTRHDVVSPQLVHILLARTQGNPFFLEELLNLLHGRGLDPRQTAALENIDLPESLHTLILSRLDQLRPREKQTMRVASIIGRVFSLKWLIGYYPALGEQSQVQADLTELHTLDLTLLDSIEPEIVYLFKHIITHEVTYESLPFATRAQLHEWLATYLENAYPEALLLETLAFHYGRSDNKAKQVEYLRRAGEAAQKNFANDAALDFYSQLLPLLQDDNAKVDIYLKRGQVYEFIGNYDETERDYRAALALTQDETALQARVQFAFGKLNRLRGDFEPALGWLAQVQEAYTVRQDSTGLVQVLMEIGTIVYRKGEHEQAQETFNVGLALARETGDQFGVAKSLHSLGNVMLLQGSYAMARTLYEESLSLRRALGDKVGISASLTNLGVIAVKQGDYAQARARYEESLFLDREMGDKAGIASLLINLGVIANDQGNYAEAQVLNEEGLKLQREMGDKWGASASLSNLGKGAYIQGEYATARTWLEEGLTLCQEIEEKTYMAEILLCLGLVELAGNKIDARERILESLRLRVAIGDLLGQSSSLVGVAGLVWQAGDAVEAAQWLGMAESALKTLDAVPESDVIYFHAQTLAQVKAALDESAFQAAFAEGAGWRLDEAVQRALS